MMRTTLPCSFASRIGCSISRSLRARSVLSQAPSVTRFRVTSERDREQRETCHDQQS
jgi:hypothetical protein